MKHFFLVHGFCIFSCKSSLKGWIESFKHLKPIAGGAPPAASSDPHVRRIALTVTTVCCVSKLDKYV